MNEGMLVECVVNTALFLLMILRRLSEVELRFRAAEVFAEPASRSINISFDQRFIENRRIHTSFDSWKRSRYGEISSFDRLREARAW